MGDKIMAIKGAVAQLPPPAKKRSQRWQQYRDAKSALLEQFPDRAEIIGKLLAQHFRI